MSKIPTILERIRAQKRTRIRQAKMIEDIESIRSRAVLNAADREPIFLKTLKEHHGPFVIAEIKRASPSKGTIREHVDLDRIVMTYEMGGAAAISVLTEEDGFQGSLSDLRQVKQKTRLPVLRKDFIFDEYQVYESAVNDADAILLIAALLDDQELKELCELAVSLGMDALVEVHNRIEIERIVTLNFPLIGVNNRNLHTFEVSLETSRNLSGFSGPDRVLVSESGLNNASDLQELANEGYDGFLIGESLMKADDPAALLAEFTAFKRA